MSAATLALGLAAGGLHAQAVGVIAQPVAPAAPPAGGASVPQGKGGLHIASGRRVALPYVRNDGAGYRWDIQRYGSVGPGTSRAYGSGMYLQVDGSRLMFTGQGTVNAAGDEVEIGPQARGNLRVYRRIKVYRDQGLARWLEILENPTGRDVTVRVRIYSDMLGTIGRTIYGSGKGRFGEEDTAFVTATQVPGAAALMHYVCTKRSKVRPAVTIQGDDIYVDYGVTVPAGKAVVLCSFESQHRSVAELTKRMEAFRPREALKDLPSSVRKLLINMPRAGSFEGVDLERSASADVVTSRHGDPIFGKIVNESFRLETLFGPMTLPAKEVIGLASAGGEDRRFRVLLTGGQVIAGRTDPQAVVRLEMPSGDTLRVPFGAVRQCAYRITKDKPEEMAFDGPLMVLRTGDRVAFLPDRTELRLRTRHGLVALDANDLLAIALDNAGHAVHRVTFLNGSQLAGFLEPRRVPLTLRLGPTPTLPRHLIARVQFAERAQPDATLDCVVLSNGDELFGRFAEETLTLRTRYGEVELRPENIRAMGVSKTHLGRASLRLWDGSVLRGQCGKETLAFQIVPGPTLDLYIGQCVQVRRSQALPPAEVQQALRERVGRLGAESYKDRQTATEELVKMGKGIAPMLREYLGASDAEVRQRIEVILERLGAAP